MASLSRPLAVALLVGTALLGAGAVLHPMLPADVSGQLRMIAASSIFRPVHLAMLCGSGLIIAGVWTRLSLGRATTPAPLIGGLALVCLGLCFNAIDIAFMGGAGWHLAMLCGSGLIIAGVWTRLFLGEPVTPTPLIGALVLVCAGLCFNAIDIAFMGGAGWHLAMAYVAGQSEMAPLFEALHRFGLLAARFGNFLVALGALLLGFAERADPASPRWMAWLAWIAAAGGLAGVVLVPEASLLMLTAVTLIAGWSVGTSVLALRGDAGMRG